MGAPIPWLGLLCTYCVAGAVVCVAGATGFVDVPGDSTATRVLVVLVAATAASNFNGEVRGVAQIPYSKFAPAGEFFSARVGWALMYFVPGAVYVAAWALHTGAPASLYHHLNLAVVAAHYAKRVGECFFVHKYSKPPPALSTFVIAAFYSFGSLVHHYLVNVCVSAAAATASPVLSAPDTYATPVAIFVVGQIINLYHHAILASLRPPGSTAYVVPHGGLFHLVAAPHYLGELVAWLGVAMVARNIFSYGAWFTMVVYLSGRALQTRHWYVTKMRDVFPPHRRALLPFVF